MTVRGKAEGPFVYLGKREHKSRQKRDCSVELDDKHATWTNGEEIITLVCMVLRRGDKTSVESIRGRLSGVQ